MEFEEQPIILFKGGFKILKSYKTEIDPTEEQTKKIKKTIGTCRFIYNFYLAKNKEIYEQSNQSMSAFSFMKWLNEGLANILISFTWRWLKSILPRFMPD